MQNDIGALEKPTLLPCWIRAVLSIFSIAVITISIIIMYSYIVDTKSASPKELGIPTLLLLAITMLIAILIPWAKYGYRIKKIGAVEIEQVVLTQKKEQADAFNSLAKRLDKLEHDQPSAIKTNKSFRRNELNLLLREFFKMNPNIAISASRIQSWGIDHNSRLGRYARPGIQSHLDQLLSEGYLRPALSKKGNTLYRLAKTEADNPIKADESDCI